MESQLNILQESLTAKRQVLLQIQEYNKKQEAVFTAEQVDMSLFDEALEEKGRLIDRLNTLDNGFEVMYEKLAKELEGNREKYAPQIRRLQQQITEIMELSTAIQAQEARNKALIEQYFSRERTDVYQSRQNAARAYSFYKSMSNLNAAGNQSSYDSKQ
ncbi:MAG: flagellar protein FliT [Lachnospiraceae bacterium]|nr:flagellar protein FliT [Lachnospiraceae bacterium]